MRKNVTFIAVLIAMGLWATTSAAFEAISFKEVPGLIGKQVYPANNADLRGAWAYAGEPLTLVSAAPYQQTAAGTTYNYVRVRTKDGKEGEMQIRFLSKAPLRFNLRNPGTARQLVVALLNDAFELPAKMHTLRSKYNYNIDADAHADEYHQVDAMNEAFTFERTLLHSLVYSANRSKQDVLREDQTKWIALASDSKILDWYSDGIADKALKAKFVNADSALSTLDNVSSFGFDLAQLAQDKEQKPWRSGMDGVPQEKLAKLDAEKLADIGKEMQRKQKQLKEAFASAAASKARAQ